MAIEYKIINGRYTEIYVGGGNFITQSTPTNFHQFYTQKILTPNENIEDFREVTMAERTALEQSDAAWREPSQSFIDMWNNAAGSYGRYNAETGFFELNGLTDISYEEAIGIYALYSATQTSSPKPASKFLNCKIRTLFPLQFYTDRMDSAIFMFKGCTFLQAIQITGKHENRGAINYDGMFSGCANLKAVYGELNLGNVTTDQLHSMFSVCKKLEEIRLVNIKVNIYLQWSPLISLESLTHMVKNTKNTQPIIIRLHSAAYARLTDELIVEAAEKQITFATT